MRLFSAIASALGEEGSEGGLRVQYTVTDGRGGYFQNVKKLDAFSEREIIFRGKKGGVRVEGENLSLGKYFAGDAVVRGAISKIERIE